ncbi:MAG: DEAD/DEAH box helicase [Neorhizobium sp.]|nr:DEAD/DEAH box helicase [Neorhizobium sp.]
MTNFHELGLTKQIVDTVTELGYENPTPIQQQAIPLLLQGRDLIGLAQTGTGKTAAFGLPLIERLIVENIRPDNRTTRSLILAPTRELVNQIATNLKGFIKKSPLRINMVVGGVSINRQQQLLERGTDILVATPGRLLDLVNRRALSLTTVRFLVLDEADQMLDLGFVHDLRKIAKMVPKRRQTMLFSATMPKAIAELAGEYLVDPVKVEVTPPGKAADKVEQVVHFVAGKGDKTELLRKSLNDNPDGRAIVFMRTKHTAEKLMKHLDNIGFSVASIHGNKSQGQRDRALKGFRDGEIKTLIATDVAARGIDIPAVSHVYNYDLPEVPDAYVHRIGRTARAGREGMAVAFCAPDETMLLRDIEKLMGIEITTASGERPEAMNRPVRGNGNANSRGGNKARGGAGNGGRGNGGQRANGGGNAGAGGREDRGPRRERPARKPFFAEGAAEAPRSQADNDLSAVSDFRPAKPRGEGRPARTEQPRGEQRRSAPKGDAGSVAKAGQRTNRDHASHGAHEPEKQRKAHNAGPNAGATSDQPKGAQNRHAPPAEKRSENRGPVRFGGGENRGGQNGENRGSGFQGRKRSRG